MFCWKKEKHFLVCKSHQHSIDHYSDFERSISSSPIIQNIGGAIFGDCQTGWECQLRWVGRKGRGRGAGTRASKKRVEGTAVGGGRGKRGGGQQPKLSLVTPCNSPRSTNCHLAHLVAMHNGAGFSDKFLSIYIYGNNSVKESSLVTSSKIHAMFM